MTDINPRATLLGKLHEVAEAVDRIEKSGRNEKQGYNYVEAARVVEAVRAEFLQRKVLVLPESRNLSHFTETNGKSFVSSIDLTYRFIDTETGHEITLDWVGAGADIGGEKGLYKAFTGGLKYILLHMFLIPTGDDPERDNTSEAGKASKDDARPAAPTIPLDRAKALLGLSEKAGHATKREDGTGYDYAAVLLAKLASVGCDTKKLADLNVDQAEDVEAWLKSEAKDA